jgi:CRP-like cAMP-binding protein
LHLNNTNGERPPSRGVSFAIRLEFCVVIRVPQNANWMLRLAEMKEGEALLSHVQNVSLEDKRVLYEPGDPITHIYFPHTSVVSLIVLSENGSAVEAATIGREGVVGLGGLVSGDVSFSRQVVQLAGTAAQIARKPFLEVLDGSPDLRKLFAAHSDVFAAQILQSVACNASHTAEERLARWLLTCLDRVDADQMALTQEFIAAMLGVRRPTVSLVACTLQAAGLISYRRGQIKVLDRSGLEEVACPCYRIIRRNYERQFSLLAA